MMYTVRLGVCNKDMSSSIRQVGSDDGYQSGEFSGRGSVSKTSNEAPIIMAECYTPTYVYIYMWVCANTSAKYPHLIF